MDTLLDDRLILTCVGFLIVRKLQTTAFSLDNFFVFQLKESSPKPLTSLLAVRFHSEVFFERLLEKLVLFLALEY